MTEPIRYTILTDRYGEACRLVVDPEGQWIFDPCRSIGKSVEYLESTGGLNEGPQSQATLAILHLSSAEEH